MVFASRVKCFKTIITKNSDRIMACFEGQLKVPHTELNLDVTLLGGQSFRWTKNITQEGISEWAGVAYNAYWVLQQQSDSIRFKVYSVAKAEESLKASPYYESLLRRYFRLDFDLPQHIQQWKKAHEHFSQIDITMKAVRVLDQEPLENILSFICSQNNNIKRISSMIQWLCERYGQKIGKFNDAEEYTFPTLASLVDQQSELESLLRGAKFGYRAKFISQTVAKIHENGGMEWFKNLRKLSYTEARAALVTLPGIGPKVADCICLMSLGHLESVPIDTHIFQIAQSSYMPELKKVKSVTPKIYDHISRHFRAIYGTYAGWAQAVLFCSGLQQFQNKGEGHDAMRSKKRRKC